MIQKDLKLNYFNYTDFPVNDRRVNRKDKLTHEHDYTEVEHHHDFTEIVFITKGHRTIPCQLPIANTITESLGTAS